MARAGHPVDVVADDLIGTYRRGTLRLEALVRDALRRGLDPDRLGTPGQQRGDATTAYRRRQLNAALAVLRELETHGSRHADGIARRAYASAILAVDHTIDPGDSIDPSVAVAGRFGGIHQRQVSVLAGNLERSLKQATATAGANIAAVFARADALDGAIPVAGLPGAPRFIGRREDDVWRRFALETIGNGTVAGDVRRQISATLVRRLIDEGVTDALTGFVDRAGRRWSLDVYAETVARTTTREAASRGLVGRMAEHGQDLVKVTGHPHAEDVCTPYDGKTFSVSGESSRYPRLDVLPPFHPRCRHVVGPASNLDEYERELGITARRVSAPAAPASSAPNVAPPTPRLPAPESGPPPGAPALDLLDPPRPPAPPLSPRAVPRADAGTLDRLEAQRVAELIAGDPGPEAGARDAWEASVGIVDQAARIKAIDEAFGPDLVRFINRPESRAHGIRDSVLNGDLTIDEALDFAEAEYMAKEVRRAERKGIEEAERGFKRRQIPCFVCGRLKRRPADVCDYCGDDPVSVDVGSKDRRANEEAFNRGYGYAY